MATEKDQTSNKKQRGIPGIRGAEHIAITVPDLEEATQFFVDVLSCQVYYSIGPFMDPEGSWMVENIDVHQKAEIPEIRILSGRNGAHFELLTFKAPDQNKTMPRFSDYGGHHIAFYVDDIEAAVAFLKEEGIKVLGSIKDGIGPEAGEGSTFVHFKAPWGAMFELVSYPHGKIYEREMKPMWVPEPAQEQAEGGQNNE